MFVYIMIVVIFFALYFIVPQKHSAIPCVLFVLAMAVMSYFVQPGETDDLARYFYIISQIEKAGYEGFRQMLESNYFDFGSFPVCGYYFYFISILKNPHFLPFFTILICYGCIILVIQKASVKFKVDKFYTMLALILRFQLIGITMFAAAQETALHSPSPLPVPIIILWSAKIYRFALSAMCWPAVCILRALCWWGLLQLRGSAAISAAE